MAKYYLGLDQGTTGVTAILFDEGWQQVSRGYREIRQIYPRSGWVEHDAADIWCSACAAVQQALDKAGATGRDVLCIGLDHEGESVMLWDKVTGTPLYNTVVWQDRRTAAAAEIASVGVAWGFRFAEELYDAGATDVVSTMEELEKVLFK